MRLKTNKRVTFDEMIHTYFLDDEKLLIGVTTLMSKHGLSPNYGGIDSETLNAAAERGTAVHHMLEDYDNGKNVITSDVFYNGKCVITSEQMQKNLDAYKKLCLSVHCSEYLVSDNEVVASFVDKVFDDCSLADVKTTSSLHKDALEWQLSIYAYLFEMANPSKKVPHLYAIHVRDGKAKLVEVNRLPDEKIKALLDAEKKGVILSQGEEELPTIETLIPQETAMSLADTEELIAHTQAQLKMMEEKVKGLREQIYAYMLENNIDEMSCGNGVYKRKKESTRESFDTKRFKAEHPELADNYVKVSTVRGSISYNKL